MLYILSIPFAGHELAEGIFLLGRSRQRGFSNGHEPTEGSFCGEKLQDKLFCGGGVRGGFVAAGRIIPIKFIGIIDKGYSYSYNR